MGEQLLLPLRQRRKRRKTDNMNLPKGVAPERNGAYRVRVVRDGEVLVDRVINSRRLALDVCAKFRGAA